jgi:hypothetical protein
MMKALRLLFLVFFFQLYLFPSIASSDDAFKEWFQEFADRENLAAQAGQDIAAGNSWQSMDADGHIITNAASPRWGRVASLCTSNTVGYSDVHIIRTKKEANHLIYSDSRKIKDISVTDQISAAMEYPDMYKRTGEKPSYRFRGELLNRHPIAVPINMMMICIAYHAQKVLPIFAHAAAHLFKLLMTIEFAWMGANWVMKQADLDAIIDALTAKMHLLSFIGCLIITGNYGFTNENWLYTIISSFSQIANDLSLQILNHMEDPTINSIPMVQELSVISAADPSDPGFPTTCSTDPGDCSGGAGKAISGELISPGSFMALGIMVITQLWSRLSGKFDLQWLLLIPIFLLVTPMILWSFGKMAADILLTVLETYLGMGMLLILMAFSASRWGGDYLQKVLLYAVMMGFKLITMSVLFVIAVRMMGYVSYALNDVHGLGNLLSALLSMIGIMCLITFLFNRLPAASGALFGGAPSLSFGQFTKDSLEFLEGGKKIIGGAAKGSYKLGRLATGKTGVSAMAKGVAKKAASKLPIVGGHFSGSSGHGAGGKRDAKSAVKGGVKGVVGALKGALDDNPSTNNFITPNIDAPSDQ